MNNRPEQHDEKSQDYLTSIGKGILKGSQPFIETAESVGDAVITAGCSSHHLPKPSISAFVAETAKLFNPQACEQSTERTQQRMDAIAGSIKEFADKPGTEQVEMVSEWTTSKIASIFTPLPVAEIVDINHKIEEKSQQLKLLLEKNEKPNLQKIEKIIKGVSKPQALLNTLTEQEKKKINAITDQAEQVLHETIVGNIAHSVKKINAQFDRGELKNQEDKFSTISPIPILQTAATVFGFFNPEKYARIQEPLSYGVQIFDGLSKVATKFGAEGFPAILEGLASGNILSILQGVSGFISFFRTQNKGDSVDQVTQKMLQGILQNIASLHADMLAGFRFTQEMIGKVDAHVLQGFEKIEMILGEHHQEYLTHFEKIRRLFHVNSVNMEEVLKLLRDNERYHVRQQINNADWRDTLADVKLVMSGSMTLETFKLALGKLTHILKKVQTDGIERASQWDGRDLFKLAFLLKITNNDKLNAEFNIHLLMRYLLSQCSDPSLIKSFPKPEDIYNPAALYDVISMTVELIQSYKKSLAYSGLPEPLMRESLNMMMDGMNNVEIVFNLFSNRQFVASLLNSYLQNMQDFSAYVKEYWLSLAAQSWGETILPKLQAQFGQYSHAIESAEMPTITMEGHSGTLPWFEHRWQDAAEGQGVMGSIDVWGGLGCVKHDTPRRDRPCHIPKEEIDAVKQIYKESYRQNITVIQDSLKNYHQTKQVQFTANHGNNDTKNLSNDFLNFILYSDKPLRGWHEPSVPYYFSNKQLLPILASNWHAQQIPQEAFYSILLGAELHFTSKIVNKILILQADWSNSDKFGEKINLFSQNITFNYGKYNPHDSEFPIHAIYSGNVPTGDCYGYDNQLKRFVDYEKDWYDYRNGKRAIYYGYRGFTTPFRAEVCMPTTVSTVGLYPNASAYAVLPPDRINWITKYPYTISSNKEHISQFISEKRNKKQAELMQSLSEILRSENEKIMAENKFISEKVKFNLLHSFSQLGVNGIALKILTTYLGDPNDAALFYDGDDIKEKLEENYGRIYLPERLTVLHRVSKEHSEQIIDNINSKRTEHYPFVYFKEAFAQYSNELNKTDIVPDWMADSKLRDEIVKLYQFYLAANPHMQAKLRELNPALEKYATYERLLPSASTSWIDSAYNFFSLTDAEEVAEPEIKQSDAVTECSPKTLFGIIPLPFACAQDVPLHQEPVKELPASSTSFDTQQPDFKGEPTYPSLNGLRCLALWASQFFPENRSQELSKKTRACLKEQLSIIKGFEKELKNIRSNDRMFLETCSLVNDTKFDIKYALNSGSISSSELNQIKNRTLNIGKRFQYIIDNEIILRENGNSKNHVSFFKEKRLSSVATISPSIVGYDGDRSSIASNDTLLRLKG